MSEIQELLKTIRPNLSQSSLKTYASILKNIFNRDEDNKDKNFNIPYFYNIEKVLNNIPKEPNKRKTYLSAIIVLLNDKDKSKPYFELMNDDADKVSSFNKSQEKTDKQKETGFLEPDELTKKYKSLSQVNKILWNEASTAIEYQKLQNQLILALYHLIEPRRLLDYTEMKINNIDKEKDNYIYSKKFYFKKYKTAKFNGTAIIPIPNELNTLIKKWLKLVKGKSDYLLFDYDFKKLTPTGLNKRLQNILGKGRSVNILRHSYLSNKYNPEKLKELEQDASNMGTSIHQIINNYVKKE